MKEGVRIWARRILMSFVLITVGFSLGRQTAPVSAPAPTEHAGAVENQLIVYAAHMTFRCFECTQIESLARELLDTEFPDYLADGRIQIVAVDYMKDEPFAHKYDIASSTLVLSRMEDGQETHFERMDEVWSHVRHRDAYMEFVRNAIWSHLHALYGEEG